MNFFLFSSFLKNSNVFGGNQTDINILEKHLIKDSNISIIRVEIGINQIGEGIFSRIKRSFIKIYNVYRCLENISKKNRYIFFVSGQISFYEKLLYVYLFGFKKSESFFLLRAGIFFDELNSPFFKLFFNLLIYKKINFLVQGKSFQNIIIKKTNYKYRPNIISLPNWTITSNFNLENKLKKILNCDFYSFVFIGWLNYNKGVDKILDLARFFKLKSIKYNIDMYGDGPLKILILNSIKNENLSINVKSGLKTDEIKKRIKDKLFYILPSKSEGLPNSMFETMSCGLIPVVSNVGCISDYIVEDKNGIFFESNKKLYEKLNKIKNDKNFLIKIIKSIHDFNKLNNYKIILNRLTKFVLK